VAHGDEVGPRAHQARAGSRVRPRRRARHPAGRGVETAEVRPVVVLRSAAPRILTPGLAEATTRLRQQLGDRWRLALALGALFVVMALLMTFPHPLRMAQRTPGDYGDAFFTQWLLR